MTERHDPHLLPDPHRGTRWVQRVLLAVLGVGLAVAAMFFLVFALVAGAILALVIGVRFWWVMRKVRAQAKATDALEGEYTVVDRVTTLDRLER